MSTQYLDFCATTPVDPRVLEVMTDVYTNHPGNADSRTHVFGTKAKDRIQKAYSWEFIGNEYKKLWEE